MFTRPGTLDGKWFTVKFCEIRAGRLPPDFSHATCYDFFRTKTIVVTSLKCEGFARLVYNYYSLFVFFCLYHLVQDSGPIYNICFYKGLRM